MSHVFLSYSHANRDEARTLVNELELAKFTVWWDDSIDGGRVWKTQIRKAIAESLAVVCCFSQESESRDKNGMYPEVRIAIGAYRKLKPDSNFLIPVRLSKCEIPEFEIDDVLTLADLERIDLFPPDTRPAGLQKLIHTLEIARNAKSAVAEACAVVSRQPTAPLPIRIVTLEFTIDRPLEQFREKDFLDALTRSTGIEASKVRIAAITSGSTRVQLQGEPDSIERVISVFSSSSALQGFAAETGVVLITWSIAGSEAALRIPSAQPAPADADAKVLKDPGSEPKVVFALHGIGTQWTHDFAHLANEQGWTCRMEGWQFGWFSVLKLLALRRDNRIVSWFQERYDAAGREKLGVDVDRGQYPSIIAAGFGTYILGMALLKYDYLKFNKVILCRSILPRAFPWDQVIKSGQVQAARNEVGVNDRLARAWAWIVAGAGSSGIDGFRFQTDRLEEQRFRYSGREFFKEGHVEAHWIPFLKNKQPFIDPRPATNIAFPPGDHPIGSLLIWIVLLVVLAFGCAGVGCAAFGYVRDWTGVKNGSAITGLKYELADPGNVGNTLLQTLPDYRGKYGRAYVLSTVSHGSLRNKTLRLVPILAGYTVEGVAAVRQRAGSEKALHVVRDSETPGGGLRIENVELNDGDELRVLFGLRHDGKADADLRPAALLELLKLEVK